MKTVLNIIKSYYKEILLLIVATIVFNYPLPYYIFTGGGSTSLNEKFTIKDSTISKGSYNLSYVYELKATPVTYLLSYVIPSWELVSISDYQYDKTESFDDLAYRDKAMLEDANRTAAFIAYKKAGKEFNITKNKYYIVAVQQEVKSDNKIKIGDEIIMINDKEINTLNELRDYIKESDEISFKLKRDEKEYTTKVKILTDEETGIRYIGLSILNLYDYYSNPKIDFNFGENESGPSAGFMLTLAIYDSLIEEDLTNGLKIVGSGVIELDGNISPIGGIRYKLIGAVNDGADIFFAPAGENYEEAIKIKEEKNYDIEIVRVSNFDEAVEYLQEKANN